jgi:hypothetical protein
MNKCAKGIYTIGSTFEHARLITGSPKAGTARPDVCRVTKITKTTVYYRNESGVSLRSNRDAFSAVVGRFLADDALRIG